MAGASGQGSDHYIRSLRVKRACVKEQNALFGHARQRHISIHPSQNVMKSHSSLVRLHVKIQVHQCLKTYCAQLGTLFLIRDYGIAVGPCAVLQETYEQILTRSFPGFAKLQFI